MENTRLVIPESWVGSNICVQYPIPVQGPKGQMGLFNTVGKFLSQTSTDFIIQSDAGELLVPKDSIHSVLKLSSIDLVKIPPISGR